MTKKQNALGQLSFLEPCWEFGNIMQWLRRGNAHLMTDNDWERLESLANRCQEIDAGDRKTLLEMREKYRK